MRIAIYARVSTKDKEQTPETQLMRLRSFVEGHDGWTVTKEYVDIAPANDLGHRTQWKKLNDDAIKKKFDAVLVFKLDRAFRSVKHMHDTLAVWDMVNIGFLSAQEGFDTTTALGRLLLNLLASLAEFELEIISERVKAGMERAKKQGKPIGRPKVDESKLAKLRPYLDQLINGELSYRKVAALTKTSVGTIQRQMKVYQKPTGE